MANGSIQRLVNWCRAMSSACGWATWCRRTRGCWRRRGVGGSIALTGESLPPRANQVTPYFPARSSRGEIGALVYATGGNTYFGKTAQLVQEALTVSHFQKAVLKIGNYLIILAVALVAVIIGFAIYRGDAILTTLQFALVLTVAAIPVAMQRCCR